MERLCVILHPVLLTVVLSSQLYKKQVTVRRLSPPAFGLSITAKWEDKIPWGASSVQLKIFIKVIIIIIIIIAAFKLGLQMSVYEWV